MTYDRTPDMPGTEAGDLAVVAADLAARPTPVGDMRTVCAGTPRERIVGWAPDGRGSYQLVEIFTGEPENERARPDRPVGTLVAGDVTGFLRLLDKHATPTCEVYCDENRGLIVAVLDAVKAQDDTMEDGPDALAGSWWDWRAEVAIPLDPEWTAWRGIDGRLLSQEEMAEHLELHRHTIVSPDAAEVLEIASTLEVTTKATFAPSGRASGYRTLVAEQESTKAGARATLQIPTQLDLRLRPYRDSPAVDVRALFRYRIASGDLKLGVKLVQADDARRRAWTSIVDDVAAHVAGMSDERAGTVLVINGQAPAPRA